MLNGVRITITLDIVSVNLQLSVNCIRVSWRSNVCPILIDLYSEVNLFFRNIGVIANNAIGYCRQINADG